MSKIRGQGQLHRCLIDLKGATASKETPARKRLESREDFFPLDSPIEILRLRLDTFIAVRKKNVQTLGDLLKLTYQDLAAIPAIKDFSIREIDEIRKKAGTSGLVFPKTKATR